jgi:hypothetical protein
MPACAPIDSPEDPALGLLNDWVSCESPDTVGVLIWLVVAAAVESSLDVVDDVVDVVHAPEVVLVELSRIDAARGVATVYPPSDVAASHPAQVNGGDDPRVNRLHWESQQSREF